MARDVASRFVERALARSGSIYGPGRVWTVAALDDLEARIASGFTIPGSFSAKWTALLAGAPAPVGRLAAETLHVHLLVAGDLSGAAKRRLLDATVAACDLRLDLPAAMAASLDTGVVRGTGVAFKLTRLSQLGFLVRAVCAWKRLEAAQRRLCLADPMAFRAWLHSVPAQGGQAQREALLHLVHPAAYEPIVSATVKQQIASAFAGLAPQAPDVDAALRTIRAALEPVYGVGFAFTEPPVDALWRPMKARSAGRGRRG